MTARRVPPNRTDPYRLAPERLRWRCDPGQFAFETTEDMQDCPIHIIGQNRAMEALRLGLSMGSEGYNIFVTGDVGSGRKHAIRMLASSSRATAISAGSAGSTSASWPGITTASTRALTRHLRTALPDH